MATVERVYDALYEDQDARACADIDERACRDVPWNFLRNAGAFAVTKLAEAVANTKTTLPWLLSSLGAPGWIAGLLVPVRESGSMLPQLVIAKWVRELAVRKWTYVIGAVLQALAMPGIAASAAVLEGRPAGLVILLLVILFSLARGLCSVASKDVLGKTVPKQRRGRVTGLAAVAGVGTLLFALAVWRDAGGASLYIWLFVVAGAM